MTQFVYLSSERGDVRRVKVGFCWPAALFGPLWAAVKRAWRLAICLALAFGSLVFLDEAYVQRSRNVYALLLMLVAYIAFMVVCGKYGNSWLIWELQREGYSPGPARDA